MSPVTRWGLLHALDSLRRPLAWPERMLIVGPVGLGDAVVALPTLRRLQREAADTRLTWLGRAAYAPIVAMMGVSDFRDSADSTSVDLKHFDAILSFADVGAESLGARERVAAVPVRIVRAAARARPRWANHLVHASRLGWPRHEAQRNLRLLLPFGHGAAATAAELGGSAPLVPPQAALPDDLPADDAVVLHPFSMGHGREWPLAHWVALAQQLASSGVPVVFTGSGADRDRLAQAWPQAQRPAGVGDASGRLDLAQLSVLLARARAVVASGTGPLHLAAALGTPALGLFPPRKGVALDRWAPLGRAAVGVQAHRRCPHRGNCQNDTCACMASITPHRVALALRPGPEHRINLGALAPWLVTTATARDGPTAMASINPGDTP